LRAAGGDGRALQERLMPFHHLLPARFRGPNARVQESQP
jgi:hypothetical protein